MSAQIGRNRTPGRQTSGKASEQQPPGKSNNADQRVIRTRDRLGDALIELLQRKPFKSITVQQVLDRAGVGRSTFYTHYRNKSDLFLSDLEDFLDKVTTYLSRRKENSDRIAPVRELCAHLVSAKPIHEAFRTSGRLQDFWELAEEAFARGIERRLAEIPRARAIAAEDRASVAHGYAGALLGLLRFWIDRGMKASPEQMDQTFHRLVWGMREAERPIRATP